jgi:hypothetical protein
MLHSVSSTIAYGQAVCVGKLDFWPLWAHFKAITLIKSPIFEPSAGSAVQKGSLRYAGH